MGETGLCQTLCRFFFKFMYKNPFYDMDSNIIIIFINNSQGRVRMVVGFTIYLCNQCISPLKLLVRIPIISGVFDTTLYDKVCPWLAAGRSFSPVSSTNKTDRHDVAEILLKLALNTITKIQFMNRISWLQR